MKTYLPETPKDLFPLKGKDWFLYNGAIKFFEWTGLWRCSQKMSGDIETMKFWDKVYWLYKTTNPITRARKNSGIEKYFQGQKGFIWTAPKGFHARTNLRITAVGDLIDHPFLKNSEKTLYQSVANEIFDSDFAMANLECPIHSGAQGEFVFSLKKAPPLFYDLQSFSIVKGFGSRRYSFMATACNHSLDFGMEGIHNTLNVLDAAGVLNHGTNRDEKQAFEATLVEKKGVKLGIIAYTFGLNAMRPPKEQPHAVNCMKLNEGIGRNEFSQVKAQLDHCQRERVDFVIAHLHWGLEHEFYPIPEQIELAHELAEMGVDAIIGHHPHVIQPVEFYRTIRDSKRIVPIYYSLGNLINTFSASYLRESALARLRIVKGQLEDGTSATYVEHADCVRICQDVDWAKKTLHLRVGEPGL